MASLEETDDDLLNKSTTSSEKDTDNDINASKTYVDGDELLLLSSPLPSPKSSKEKSSSVTTSEVVDLVDDADLEILEEATPTTVPEKSFTASEPETSESLSEGDESVEELDENMNGKISIFYSHGSFLLWNADDVHMLREECRIVGKLVGCLPRAPRQNLQLGLPLQLMPEEAKLLVDIDAASVVVERPVSETASGFRKAAFDNVRQQNFKIQQQLYKKARREDVSQRMGEIIAGKKAKKRKMKETKSTSPSDYAAVSNEMKNSSDSPKKDEDAVEQSVPEKESKTDMENKTESSEIDDRLGGKEDEDKIDNSNGSAADEKDNKGKNDNVEEEKDLDNLTVDDIVQSETSAEHALVQLFTENPWKQTTCAYTNWKFPSNEREQLRYHVFKDLWGKGFYLTSGAKFGGDFLVYPGDPARYHSHYIAVCRNQFDEMPCLDLVSLGRLASNVRKTALLCALDRNRKVTYTSLTWTGMS